MVGKSVSRRCSAISYGTQRWQHRRDRDQAAITDSDCSSAPSELHRRPQLKHTCCQTNNPVTRSMALATRVAPRHFPHRIACSLSITDPPGRHMRDTAVRRALSATFKRSAADTAIRRRSEALSSAIDRTPMSRQTVFSPLLSIIYTFRPASSASPEVSSDCRSMMEGENTSHRGRRAVHQI